MRRPPLLFLLTKVGFHVSTQVEARLQPLGLVPPHIGILQYLAVEEAITQKAVAEWMQVPASQMVGYVDDLEELGAVERRRNPEDRRAWSLSLTADGRELVEDLRARLAELEAELLGDVSDDQADALREALVAIAGTQDLPLGVHPGPRGGPPRP